MRGRSEQGSATTWAVLFLAAVTVVAVVFAGAASALVGIRKAQAAADLAALAAAGAVIDGADGCSRAEHLATRNGARLESCSVTPLGDVRVVVAVEVHGPWPEAVVVRGRARAGTQR